MTRVVVTPAILGILVTAMVAGALPAGCSSNHAGLGPQKMDAQAPGMDAPVGSGGAAGAGSYATAAGGVTGGGGVTATGGITHAGGSVGSGGATQAGGSTASGGATQAGGATASGGATQVGGSTASGGATQTGGATASGGATQAGGSTASGGTKSGGSTASGGTKSGGSTASGGTKSGGSLASGGATQTGGSTGTGGTKGSTGGSGGGGTGSGCLKDAGTSDAAPGSCGLVTTREECDGRNDCHSVFVDSLVCGCSAIGCCAHFSLCAAGGRANCTGFPICQPAPPFCGAPYVVSHTSYCWEGCVLESECAGADAGITPPTCPQTPPANASSCGSGSLTCFYDNCPSGSRTQAVCAGGNWTVETAACGTVTCDPDPSGSARTCSSGQVCVTVGAYSFACVVNPCTTNPVVQNQVPAQCTYMSTCSVHYSLTNGVTFTCPNFLCPPFCV
jgi:hypothetical protein